MMTEYKNIPIEVSGDMSDKEIIATIDQLIGRHLDKIIKSVTISVANIEEAVIVFTYQCVEIQRIRRITGYLVGTLDRFNDAKRVEERDRLKHPLTKA